MSASHNSGENWQILACLKKTHPLPVCCLCLCLRACIYIWLMNTWYEGTVAVQVFYINYKYYFSLYGNVTVEKQIIARQHNGLYYTRKCDKRLHLLQLMFRQCITCINFSPALSETQVWLFHDKISRNRREELKNYVRLEMYIVIWSHPSDHLIVPFAQRSFFFFFFLGGGGHSVNALCVCPSVRPSRASHGL